MTSVAEDIHTGKFHGNKTLAAGGGVTNNDVSNGSSQGRITSRSGTL